MKRVLPKAPGTCGCAHCQKLGARRACVFCGRPVCETCYATPSSCSQSRHYELRLPRGLRLQAVTPDGRVGLARRALGRSQLVELLTGERLTLQALRWRYPRGTRLISPADPLGPPLHQDQLIQVQALADQPPLTGSSLPPASARPGYEMLVRAQPLAESYWLVHVSSSLRHLSFSEDQLVLLAVLPNEEALALDLCSQRATGPFSLGQKVVHSAAVSSVLGLVALGGFGEVALFELSSGQPLGLLRFPSQDVIWLGIQGQRLVGITKRLQLLAFSALPGKPPSSWPLIQEGRLYQERPAGQEGSEHNIFHFVRHYSGFAGTSAQPRIWEAHLERAALSDSGHIFAAAASWWIPTKWGDYRRIPTVYLYFIQSGQDAFLPDHRSRTDFVGFVHGGRILLTADATGRVFFWSSDTLVSSTEPPDLSAAGSG